MRDGRLLFVELKSERGRVSAGQMAWLHQLRLVEAACVENDCRVLVVEDWPVQVHVWRPADWRDGTIEKALQR